MRAEVSRSENTVWHPPLVDRAQREARLGQKSRVLWFTGLSGSGKSTIAHAVERTLADAGRLTYVFDGDNVRHGLCADLGFSEADRHENLRRIGEMVRLFIDAGILCLTAFISPFRADREQLRTRIGPHDFIEIHCRCTLETCIERDVKGLYRRALAGEIADFTGVSSPYEAPERPDLVLDTDRLSVAECVERVLTLLAEKEGREVIR